jgi:hypothetical protein
MATYRKQLEKEFRGTGIRVDTTNNGHLCLTLPNGRKIHTSGTPSDRRSYLNMRALVRRSIRERA